MITLLRTTLSELKTRQKEFIAFCKKNVEYLDEILKEIITSLYDESLRETVKGGDYDEWVNRVSE
jgi:hypothetical protein